jgi:hypothetical protein
MLHSVVMRYRFCHDPGALFKNLNPSFFVVQPLTNPILQGQKSLCNACGIRWKRANKYKLSSGIKKKKPEKKARHIVKTLPRRTDAERFSRFVETVESITSDDDFAGDDDDFVPNTPPERYERVYDSDSESRAASDNDRSPDDQTVAAWLYFIAQQTPQPMTA